MYAVINREFGNPAPDGIAKLSVEGNQAKLDEPRRGLDRNCCRRMWRSQATGKADGTWVLNWKKACKAIRGAPRLGVYGQGASHRAVLQ